MTLEEARRQFWIGIYGSLDILDDEGEDEASLDAFVEEVRKDERKALGLRLAGLMAGQGNEAVSGNPDIVGR
jgi:hypothetical protein